MALAAGTLILGGSPAREVSGSFVFTKVADTSTPVPGGPGTFIGFGAPSISGGAVIFHGEGMGSREGIYISGGGELTRVVDTTTPVPGGPGTFTMLDTLPSISGGTVAFLARGGGPGALYTASGGVLTKVVDEITPVPGSSDSFSSVGTGNPSISGGTVAFFGSSLNSTRQGIYTGTGGAPTRIADTSTPIPGGSGTFNNFVTNGPSISEGTVVFHGIGSGDQQGIYTGTGGALTRVVDRSTPVPGGPGTFTMLDRRPSISGGTVAFVGVGSDFSDRGIFTATGGALTRVVDRSTPVPGGPGTFDGFAGVVISGETVAFVGFHSGMTGVYESAGGKLLEVVSHGDVLDGRIISSLFLGSSYLDGTTLAFRASFTDGTSGIYTAAVVPEPPSLMLTLAGLISIATTASVRRSRATDGG